VQLVAASGPLTVAQPLVKFPHRIAQPGQLQRAQIAVCRGGGQMAQPRGIGGNA
jgi:hypothetical protein